LGFYKLRLIGSSCDRSHSCTPRTFEETISKSSWKLETFLVPFASKSPVSGICRFNLKSKMRIPGLGKTAGDGEASGAVAQPKSWLRFGVSRPSPGKREEGWVWFRIGIAQSGPLTDKLLKMVLKWLELQIEVLLCCVPWLEGRSCKEGFILAVTEPGAQTVIPNDLGIFANPIPMTEIQGEILEEAPGAELGGSGLGA